MAKLCLLLSFLVVLAVVAQTTTARDVPSETNNGVVGLNDQKNVFAFGGLGGFLGLGNNGQAVGGAGIGVGVGGIGNANGIGGGGIGGGYGYGGLGAAAGAGVGVGTFGGAVPFP